MPWMVFETPNLDGSAEFVPTVLALYVFDNKVIAAWELGPGGSVSKVTGLTLDSLPGAIDRLGALTDGGLVSNPLMQTLSYEGKVYTRHEGKVYCIDAANPLSQFVVTTLPPGLVKLRGGGIGILDDEA